MRRSSRTAFPSLRLVWSALLVLGALAAPARPAAAQAVTGTLTGIVGDATGAVLPGVSVTIVQTETGFRRTLVTDANGEYTRLPFRPAPTRSPRS
jgi:hypothetical protein